MKFLLRLKHWQLFGLTWGFAIVMNLFIFSEPELMRFLMPIQFALFSIGIFGWIWSISTNLNKLLPPEASMNLNTFRILFSVPILYILFMSVFMFSGLASSMNGPENIEVETLAAIFIPLHLLSIFLIVWGMRFAAKTIKSVELGRKARFADYIGEFVLIWFSVAGYWLLQPRLNRLVERNTGTNNRRRFFKK